MKICMVHGKGSCANVKTKKERYKMKKLMMGAMVAMAAVCAQAGSIQWGARNIYIPVAKDVAVSESGIVPLSGDKFAIGALDVNLFWVDDKGADHFINSYALDAVGQVKTVTLGNNTTDADLYNAMNAIAAYTPKYHMTATYETKDGVYTYDGYVTSGSPIANLPSGNNSVTANFGATSGNPGSWTYTANAVPEPTSGLLLLLGVAGLALRRRRA